MSCSWSFSRTRNCSIGWLVWTRRWSGRSTSSERGIRRRGSLFSMPWTPSGNASRTSNSSVSASTRTSDDDRQRKGVQLYKWIEFYSRLIPLASWKRRTLLTARIPQSNNHGQQDGDDDAVIVNVSCLPVKKKKEPPMLLFFMNLGCPS